MIEQDLEDQIILFERGLTQATDIRDLKREQARLQGILGELIARKAQAEGLITEIEIETVKISSTRHETAISQLRDQHYREMELKEQRRALKQQLARLDIKAPVSGIFLWPAGLCPTRSNSRRRTLALSGAARPASGDCSTGCANVY